jgi:hypothetical protein
MGYSNKGLAMKRRLLVPTFAVLLISMYADNAEVWYVSILGAPSFNPHSSVIRSSVDIETGFHVGTRPGRLGLIVTT